MVEEREIKAGQAWRWMGNDISISRVAKDQSWADIFVMPPNGNPWTKRQPLPMAGAVLMRESLR